MSPSRSANCAALVLERELRSKLNNAFLWIDREQRRGGIPRPRDSAKIPGSNSRAGVRKFRVVKEIECVRADFQL